MGKSGGPHATRVALRSLVEASEVSEPLMKPAPCIDSVPKLIIHNLICADKVISSQHTA